jgi:hypothetical protein
LNELLWKRVTELKEYSQDVVVSTLGGLEMVSSDVSDVKHMGPRFPYPTTENRTRLSSEVLSGGLIVNNCSYCLNNSSSFLVRSGILPDSFAL